LKIGVISDTHGDAASWRRIMEGVFRDVELIVHAGDILYHGPRNPLVEGYDPRELAGRINSCPVPVLFARGNCDAPVDQLMLNYPIQAPYLFLQVGDLRIMAHHGDGLDHAEMMRLARLYHAGVFISGHTHVPALGNGRDVEAVFLNPGSPSLPKGDSRPTAALMECEEGSLKIKIIHIDDGSTGEQLAMGWVKGKLFPER